MLGCIRLVKVKSQQKTYHMGKKIEKSGIRNLGWTTPPQKLTIYMIYRICMLRLFLSYRAMVLPTSHMAQSLLLFAFKARIGHHEIEHRPNSSITTRNMMLHTHDKGIVQ